MDGILAIAPVAGEDGLGTVTEASFPPIFFFYSEPLRHPALPVKAKK